MGNEEVLYESEERQTVPDVINFLRQLADRMTDQQIVLSKGDEELVIEIPHNVILEIEIEREEEGPGKIKTSLEIELEWTEDKATLGGEYSAVEEDEEGEEAKGDEEGAAAPAAGPAAEKVEQLTAEEEGKGPTIEKEGQDEEGSMAG